MGKSGIKKGLFVPEFYLECVQRVLSRCTQCGKRRWAGLIWAVDEWTGWNLRFESFCGECWHSVLLEIELPGPISLDEELDFVRQLQSDDWMPYSE